MARQEEVVMVDDSDGDFVSASCSVRVMSAT